MSRPDVTRVYRKKGMEIARLLEPLKEYSEIGQQLGISRQMAEYHALVGLGKLAFRIKEMLMTVQNQKPYENRRDIHSAQLQNRNKASPAG
jgi:hypothetical protein